MVCSIAVLTYTREKGEVMELNYIEPPSIGEILREEFMEPMELSAYGIAQAIHVPVSRIQDILHNRRKITIDTSLRLAKLFGVSDEYFINMQNDIDIRMQKRKLDLDYSKLKQYNMHNGTIKENCSKNVARSDYPSFRPILHTT